MKQAKTLIALSLLLATTGVLADPGDDVRYMQTRWAEVNYQLEGSAQETAFEQLVEDAGRFTSANPGEASIWIWSGIIKSSYAGARGGLGALGLAKESKADLEQALDLDDKALDGSAYTSLGTLYFMVPGWPVGFGDDEKAEELLKAALTLNPEGIDPNYFYGTYLIEEKRYDEARSYLNRAAAAKDRPGREVADAGRRQEIADALASIAGK